MKYQLGGNYFCRGGFVVQVCLEAMGCHAGAGDRLILSTYIIGNKCMMGVGLPLPCLTKPFVPVL